MTLRDSPDLFESNTFLAISPPPPKHPFKGQSDLNPPASSNPNLEKYISLTTAALSSLPMPHTHPNLSLQELESLNSLKRNKDFTIKKADKGSCIVVEDTSNYIDNGIAHLQDTTIYRKLIGNPTQHMSESIGRFIDDLHSQNYIDKHTHSFLKPPGTPRTQKMYLLKKVHKNPHGIRPIVSGCSGPTEKISAFLDHYLKPLVPLMPSYIRDSGHIISILESTSFPQDCLLVTIDVSSLYLNIPQDEGTS